MKENEIENSAVSSKNSMRTFVIFCVAVGLIILIALCVRVFLLLKESKFDGHSGFTMMIHENTGKKAVVYAFDPKEGTVGQVVITSSTKLPNIAQTLSIPLDGQIRKNSIPETKEFPLELTSSSLYSQSQQNDISVIDALRLWWLSHAISETKRQSVSLTLPDESETIDMKLDEVFIDSRLETDKKSITVINGTAVSGLGGRLEKMLSRIGASVISITTSHGSLPESKIIYYGEKSYTVERLQNILPYRLEQRDGTALSDIIIEIGEDSQRTNLF